MIAKSARRFLAAAVVGAAALNLSGCGSEYHALRSSILSQGALAPKYSFFEADVTATVIKQMAVVAETPEQRSEVISLARELTAHVTYAGRTTLDEATAIASSPESSSRRSRDQFEP